MNLTDTIVAISSAVAPAARLIVRLSGPVAIELLRSVAPDADVGGARVSYTGLHLATLEASKKCGAPRFGAPSRASTDEGTACGAPPTVAPDVNFNIPAWVYVFRAPNSYTGDDLIEFHLPGNVLLARMLVESLAASGARLAEPGEFTARAFLNGRLDLTAAEGVALAIHAQHADELRAARQLMAGELSRRLLPVLESLVATLALVEAGIDFTEEDISFISKEDLHVRLNEMRTALRDLMANTARFERLSHEPTFVLVGRPNAGKSTLLNALAGADRAVTSDVAGTTRDGLSAHVTLPRGRVIVIDVAGWILRTDDVGARQASPADVNLQNAGDAGVASTESSSANVSIARQMQARAQRAVEEADFVIHVIDVADSRIPLALSRSADMVVLNKQDAIPVAASETDASSLRISAKTGVNLDLLRSRMSDLAFGRSTASSSLALNTRHVHAIEAAQRSIEASLAHSHAQAEMIAHDLRHALDVIGQVLGQVTPDDVLGKIFAGFCIGK